MKSLKILFSIFLFTMLATSCVNDDPLAKIKYQVVGLDSSVAEIKYTNSRGTTTDVLLNGDINKFAGGSDSKTVGVNFIPFDSDLKVTVNNSSPTLKSYTLVIYVDGEPKASTNLSAPANAISTGEVSYTIE